MAFLQQVAALEMADYGATKALLAQLRPNYIFHLAAQAIVQQAFADPETTLGPMINEKAVLKIQQLVEDAVAKGAKVLLGGQRLNRPGYYYHEKTARRASTALRNSTIAPSPVRLTIRA